jgi:hypothetical protein
MLSAKRDSLVWVADRFGILGPASYGTLEKITYLPEKQIAFSVWGDHIAVSANQEFRERIKAGTVSLSDSENSRDELIAFGKEIAAKHQIPKDEPAKGFSRGLLVIYFGEKPTVYRLNLTNPPAAFIIEDLVVAGDPWGPAGSFVHYYWRRTPKHSVGELLLLGAHMIRVAEAMNGITVQGMSAWVYQNNHFRELPDQEANDYMELSKQIDGRVLEELRKSSLPK